jgi:CBS domain containing-hemolysin-like protein
MRERAGKRRSLSSRAKKWLTVLGMVGLGIVVLAIVGIVELGPEAMSVRGFLAPALAAITFAICFLGFAWVLAPRLPFRQRLGAFLAGLPSGAVAGLVWWAVAQSDSAPLAAAAVGAVLGSFAAALD